MAAAGSRNRIIVIVVAIVVAVLVFVGVRTLLGSGNDTQAMVEKAVDDLKEQTTFPQQVDEVTTLDDVTAEASAIHYFYTISGVDTSTLTDEDLKATVVPSLCDTNETKDLLDADVTMKYSYEVEENDDSFDFDATEADC